jgi:hypothetical protein
MVVSRFWASNVIFDSYHSFRVNSSPLEHLQKTEDAAHLILSGRVKARIFAQKWFKRHKSLKACLVGH